MVLAVVALVVSCGERGPTVLRHSFDGETCECEGPRELEAGPVVVEFINRSNIDAALDLDIHTDHHSIEDAKDRINAGETSRPSWARPVATYEVIAPGKRYRWEGELEAGVYHSVIVTRPDGYELHFCSGFEVSGPSR
jgi:hypothetical protein